MLIISGLSCDGSGVADGELGFGGWVADFGPRRSEKSIAKPSEVRAR